MTWYEISQVKASGSKSSTTWNENLCKLFFRTFFELFFFSGKLGIRLFVFSLPWPPLHGTCYLATQGVYWARAVAGPTPSVVAQETRYKVYLFVVLILGSIATLHDSAQLLRFNINHSSHLENLIACDHFIQVYKNDFTVQVGLRTILSTRQAIAPRKRPQDMKRRTKNVVMQRDVPSKTWWAMVARFLR